MEEKYESKPPVGLKPIYVWKSERIQDILAAMRRYSSAELPIPIAWITELEAHLGIEQ